MNTDSSGHGATARAQRREMFGDIRLAAMKPGLFGPAASVLDAIARRRRP
ncbi:hypothetical protein LC55x_4860 [Lysobacter capsici]|nr:hypothetical protein LC55x_4860 [Lysobacter capsici]